MRILSRYVFREIVSSALLGTLLATFVIFLRGVDKYFELLVRSSAKTGTVLWLFALALPPVLPLTVPFGVLVGILIGLGASPPTARSRPCAPPAFPAVP